MHQNVCTKIGFSLNLSIIIGSVWNYSNFRGNIHVEFWCSAFVDQNHKVDFVQQLRNVPCNEVFKWRDFRVLHQWIVCRIKCTHKVWCGSERKLELLKNNDLGGNERIPFDWNEFYCSWKVWLCMIHAWLHPIRVLSQFSLEIMWLYEKGWIVPTGEVHIWDFWMGLCSHLAQCNGHGRWTKTSKLFASTLNSHKSPFSVLLVFSRIFCVFLFFKFCHLHRFSSVAWIFPFK